MKANLVPAIILAIGVFWTFRWCYLRCGVAGKITLVVLGLVATIPAVLFAGNYVLYVPYANWFYRLHVIPGAEIASGTVTALLGVVYASAKLRPSKLNAPALAVCTLLSSGLLVTPFARQLLWPADYNALTDRWKDGVCIQTSRYTCVPACTATYLRLLGVRTTEAQLARMAGTTRTGTEYWYLARALRKMGYEPARKDISSVRTAPVPSILGVVYGDTGHVVVLLGKDDMGATIAEPLRGRRHYSWSTMGRCYESDGTCITITKSGASHSR